ncbi:hypothetical protein [Cellulomonas sp. P5_C5]
MNPRGVEHSARSDAEFCPVALSAPTRTARTVRTIALDLAARAALLASHRDPPATVEALLAACRRHLGLPPSAMHPAA